MLRHRRVHAGSVGRQLGGSDLGQTSPVVVTAVCLQADGELVCNVEVRRGEVTDSGVWLEARDTVADEGIWIHTKWLINCAGLQAHLVAQRIAGLSNIPKVQAAMETAGPLLC